MLKKLNDDSNHHPRENQDKTKNKQQDKTGNSLDGIYQAMSDAIKQTLGEFDFIQNNDSKQEGEVEEVVVAEISGG